MLYHVFLLFIVFHFVFLVLAIEKKKMGYLTMALLFWFTVAFSAGFIIEYPLVSQPVNIFTNSTTTTTTANATLLVQGMRSPLTMVFWWIWLMVDGWVALNLIQFGRKSPRWF